MAAKVSGYLGKLLAVVFTSLVAPVLVDVAVRDIHAETDKATLGTQPAFSERETQQPLFSLAPAASPQLGWQASQPPRPLNPAARTVAPTDEVACVIARGVGRSPDEALRDALRAALQRAAAARVDAATWASSGQALLENLWRDSGGLILGWNELDARKEWRLRGSVHHEEVAVRLNYRLLDDRLRAFRTLGWNRYEH